MDFAAEDVGVGVGELGCIDTRIGDLDHENAGQRRLDCPLIVKDLFAAAADLHLDFAPDQFVYLFAYHVNGQVGSFHVLIIA